MVTKIYIDIQSVNTNTCYEDMTVELQQNLKYSLNVCASHI